MAKVSAPRVWGALLLLGAGCVALSSGFVGVPAAVPTVAGLPGAAIAEIGGGILLVAGVALAFSAVRPQMDPAPAVPAHVAFSSRQAQALPPPAPKPAQRAARAKPAGLAEVEEQIRDVSRKINKASVMLATGKLSGEGYARYVEELKRQRGTLEAERHRVEHGE